MQENLILYLDSIHPLSPAIKTWLHENLKVKNLHKKDIFLHPGEICSNISFIIKGLLRSYYISYEGTDTTVWFMKETDVCISVKSFFERVPGSEYIEALEESLLLYITYDELQEAYRMFPEFNVLGRMLTEKYYILSEERLLGLRNQRARDRYAFLIRHHPEIILRAASQHIASYLDIDKATLSRLKSKR